MIDDEMSLIYESTFDAHMRRTMERVEEKIHHGAKGGPLILSMPPQSALYALALQLERRRKREERVCGPNSNADHLQFMRNRLLEAATDAERSGE